jgi:class 3 adenylate cyclase
VLIQRSFRDLFITGDSQGADIDAVLSPSADAGLREIPLVAQAGGETVRVICTFIRVGNQTAVRILDRTDALRHDDSLRHTKTLFQNLLHRLMPRYMVTRMQNRNQGRLWEVVPHATFTFLAIADFAGWCRAHKATEIMAMLDEVVSAYDRLISEYPALTKIKVCNGAYMAAGGLGNEEAGRDSPEVQMVEFCIKCVEWTRGHNGETKDPIQLKIGVHCGGPIIAGVLGKDKPFFDVYGDSVNMAARLEQFAPELDVVHLSEELMQALPPDKFELEQLLDVTLKGKAGKFTTYLLRV